MNDDQFEMLIDYLASNQPGLVAPLIARDKTQRECLTRLLFEKDELADGLTRQSDVLGDARAELAEAVGLLQLMHKADGGRIDFHLHNRIDEFLARHAQADQPKDQGAQAWDERELFNRAYEEICNRPITIRDIAQRMWMARAALATQPAAGEPVAKYRERSNHDVIRRDESQPCFCWAERDHRIGEEVHK